MDLDKLRAAIDEAEAWARAASQAYPYATDGGKVPEGGVHWTWVTGENWEPVKPDPATMELVEGSDGSWAANLATVEEWQAGNRPMPRTYANSIVEMDSAAAGHIVRHDPAATLRMVAAHRKILDRYEEAEAAIPEDERFWHTNENGQVGGLYFAVVAIAEGYGIEP